MSSWLKNAVMAVFLAVTLASPASAQVPDPYARELAQQLARVEHLLNDNGYQRAAGPFAGGLAARQGRRFPVTLRAGQDYRIVGVCDRRCGDLDLRLYDSANALIGQDVLEDDTPILHVRPTMTGQYWIEAIVYSCTGDRCFFAFNVYSN